MWQYHAIPSGQSVSKKVAKMATRKVEKHFQTKVHRIPGLKITREVVNLCGTWQSSPILITQVHSIHSCWGADCNRSQFKAEKYRVRVSLPKLIKGMKTKRSQGSKCTGQVNKIKLRFTCYPAGLGEICRMHVLWAESKNREYRQTFHSLPNTQNYRVHLEAPPWKLISFP